MFWTTCGLTVIAAAVAASIPASLVHRPGQGSGTGQPLACQSDATAAEEARALLVTPDIEYDVATTGAYDTSRKTTAEDWKEHTEGEMQAGQTVPAVAAPAGDVEQQRDTFSSSGEGAWIMGMQAATTVLPVPPRT